MRSDHRYCRPACRARTARLEREGELLGLVLGIRQALAEGDVRGAQRVVDCLFTRICSPDAVRELTTAYLTMTDAADGVH